jgi:hypothetical protein
MLPVVTYAALEKLVSDLANGQKHRADQLLDVQSRTRALQAPTAQ